MRQQLGSAAVDARRYCADLVIIEDGTAACNVKLHPDLVQRLLGAAASSMSLHHQTSKRKLPLLVGSMRRVCLRTALTVALACRWHDASRPMSVPED